MIAVTGIAAAVFGGVGAALVLAAVVNMASGIGRMAFDSIVQRDAPDANQGRAFAQFETRFQLSWAVAGVIPVLFTFPGRVGFLTSAWSGCRRSCSTCGSRALERGPVDRDSIPSRRPGRGARPTDPVRRSPPGSARHSDGREAH